MLNWNTLSTYERDLLIAEQVMGQTDFTHPGFYWNEIVMGEDGDGWSDFACPRCCDKESAGRKCVRPYSDDIDAAGLVEEEIKRRELIEEYTYALIRIVTNENASIFYSAIEVYTHEEWNGHRVVWSIARATPEQRCLAALRAVGVEVSNGE